MFARAPGLGRFVAMAVEAGVGVKKGEMSGRCSVCRHPDRYRIELALAAGVAVRPLGRKYGLPFRSINRHYLVHVPDERKAQLIGGPVKLHELAERAAEEGLGLLEYLGMIRSALFTQFYAATESGDRNGAATVSGRLLETIRITAQLSGEMVKPGATITNNTLVMASPLMADLQAMLIQRLKPYPDAAKAVLAGLRELSDRALGNAPLPGSAALPALEAQP
jgi:hypothetical protein